MAARKEILLIDDDVLVSEMTRAVLESLGYNPTVATSAEAALMIFSANPRQFDLIMVDHIISDANSVNLAADLLCICSDIPIALYTGGQTTIEDVRAQGLRTVIPKGVSRRELGEALKFVFDSA